jgi:thioredoxin reductase (NADPH)
MSLLDLLVVGAGPAGLATAIAAQGAGLDYLVLEKGVLVNSLFHYPRYMVFFTTPELLEIGGLPLVTPYEKPTLTEGLKYYRRVCDTYALKVTLGEEVVSIASAEPGSGGAPFRVETTDEAGERHTRPARAVVIATGYYDNPNRLGVPGEDLPHVAHYYSEPHAFYRKDVVIVGGKNSAAIAALELYRAGARVLLVHRGRELGSAIKYWIRPDIENRIKEGSIAARFQTRVVEIEPRSAMLEGPAGIERVPADGLFLLTGYRPDVSLLRGAGVRVDESSLVPAHDPVTLETNVPGLYLAGAIVSGLETNRVFIENGRFHGEAIVAAIRARRAAAEAG